MSKQLDDLIEQSKKLSIVEKQFLANILLNEVKQEKNLNLTSLQPIQDEIEKRKQHTQWVKDHQTEYAGKYVALDGYCLVGEGSSYPEAYEMARKAGINKPFVTQVFAPDSIIFGGW